MAERRPMGSVQADVLQELWAADGFLTAADVRDALDYELAYTTVNTILARLASNGLVERTLAGRSYIYRAELGEDELTADRMHRELERARDRTAALSRFVDTLTKTELAALRRRLTPRSR
jgi:predicted transcriptional regulator